MTTPEQDREPAPFGQQEAGAPTAPQTPAAPPPAVPPSRTGGRDPLAGSTNRLSGLWLFLTAGAAVLVLLLVFILQNSERIEVHLYGAHWNAPVGVALLMAAALGVLLVVIPGGGRILQLRRATRRAQRHAATLRDTTATTDAAQPTAASNNPQP